MKIALYAIAFFLLFNNCSAQSQIISNDEYEKVFQFAVRETNEDFPFIFKVTTESIENGKTVRTVTEINERESPGHERIKKTVIADGKETNSYQIKFGFGNVFCSNDGLSWKTSKYECDSERMIYGPRELESVEYSVEEKTVNDKKVKIYRKYSVFSPSEGNKEFSERISTIDSRGFFITVKDTEGIINPKTVTLRREQSWETKAKFKPIVAPKIN